MSKIFEQLVAKRGLDQDFLNPKYDSLTDPFTLSDMDQAVARIEKAVNNQEKILIYGDYDVDGVTASTLMEQALILAGIEPKQIEIMLPNRFTDGYGMSSKLIKRVQKDGVDLVITVDCGSQNHQIIDELNSLHIDSIITDHHETTDTMPDAIAVINPKRKDRPTNTLQNLAGVGVAFKLAEALVQHGLIKGGQEKWLLDLVLIGTICDNMLLIGENRILGYYGFKVLTKTRRPGLIEMIRRIGIKNLNTDAIGFQIGPRLNAAGRLDTAELALDLLRANDQITAAPLVEQLERLNKKRKNEQDSVVKEIEQVGITNDPVIIKTGKWHEGILGIVAGRLVEQYHKPAFVLSEVEPNIFKGSGRSFGDFDLANALTHVRDTIINGGGHSAAAGVKVASENLDAFHDQINQYYHSLKLPDQTKFLKQHADLDVPDFAELDLNLLDELRSLEPYGAGNEEPIFRLQDVEISNLTRMGAMRNHLRLDLKDKKGRHLKLVAFYAPEEWLTLDSGYDRIEPLVKLSENDFNGVKSLEARICDIIRL